jgi:hypothetical protein
VRVSDVLRELAHGLTDPVTLALCGFALLCFWLIAREWRLYLRLRRASADLADERPDFDDIHFDWPDLRGRGTP